jgi:hypothetical protein
MVVEQMKASIAGSLDWPPGKHFGKVRGAAWS